jgi:hypothetical protein
MDKILDRIKSVPLRWGTMNDQKIFSLLAVKEQGPTLNWSARKWWVVLASVYKDILEGNVNVMPKIFRAKRHREVNNGGLVVTGAHELVCERKILMSDCVSDLINAEMNILFDLTIWESARWHVKKKQMRAAVIFDNDQTTKQKDKSSACTFVHGWKRNSAKPRYYLESLYQMKLHVTTTACR